jgi:ribosomal protein S12 methylthiotransferase accessory factor YcaO
LIQDLARGPKFRNILGNWWHEAYAFHDRISRHEKELYGSALGSGTDASLEKAVFKAISEGLERIAFIHCQASESDRRFHGFDVQADTTGMAAFPGFTTKGARLRARWEAIERIAVMAFAERRWPTCPLHLPETWSQLISGVEILVVLNN